MAGPPAFWDEMANPTVEPPAAAKPKSKPSIAQAFKVIFSKSADTSEEKSIAGRRRFVMAAVLGTLTLNLLMFLRFFFPRALYEPKSQFKIGFPSDFGFGVDTKFQKDHRIWVVRNTEGIFVISAICTHLGCTPDWKPSENKFKCPCHGSGYDPEGINFEGPAPRPMDRAHVELAPDGQIQVDLSHLYSWPKGERSQFGDPGAILRV
ncbi:MAG TPA: Rieske 2Fe-2S domain-containing protein [Bryobacteraceae bacterium]|nr:Rieske 2Fe-2S domain-containing protein [Bryobacteraceae bacterium]